MNRNIDADGVKNGIDIRSHDALGATQASPGALQRHLTVRIL